MMDHYEIILTSTVLFIVCTAQAVLLLGVVAFVTWIFGEKTR